MKKSLIASAGVAAFAMAAVPFAGVFAATGDGATTGSSSYADTLSVKIDTACTFARQAFASGGVENNTTHKNDQGTWASDTLSATVTNSSLTSLGSSNFKVVCNNTAGYKVTVATTGLTSGDNTIANNDTYTNAISGWSPIYNDTKLVGDSTTPATVKSVSATTDDDTFEVSYSVGVSSKQQAGTYGGNATYTFAQL